MADLGTFVLFPTSSGGGGEAVPFAVDVPGNAVAIAARAVTATDLITVTADGTDSVEITWPVGATFEEMMEISSALSYIFGSVMEGELGWLTVEAKGILGFADSSDPGGAPDYVPVAGTVTFSASLSRPIRILSTGEFLAVAPISATFDSDGELSFDGEKDVRIIAPLWTGLSNTTWRWNFDVRPGPGQTWSPFSGNFTGSPGETVNIASAL